MGVFKQYNTQVPNNTWGGPTPTNTKQDLATWLIANPDFDDRPATMEEFLGPKYLDIDANQNPSLGNSGVVRPGVRQALIDIFGEEIDPDSISEKREALFTGGIGIGKTTMASVALAYMVHWVSCLHDPQKYFGLMPGSRIAFMLMSTKDSQAKEVLFGDIKARINHSKWFKANCTFDPNYKNQLRFPKDIWVLPGNSLETTFEGYNILGGILDEGDSHKVTEEKDYAEIGSRTILARITSRFTNPQTGKHRGLLIYIGQMKKADGFMARKKKMLEKDSDAKVVFMAIWESIGWEKFRNPKTGEVDCFYLDVDRKQVVPNPVAKSMGSHLSNIIKIPMSYFKDFDLDPVQALKDHAGIPPHVEDPFISTPDRVDIAQQKWHERYSEANIGIPAYMPVSDRPDEVQFHQRLNANLFGGGASLRRALHVDIGYASHGDAAGMAMAHIPELVMMDGELKPIIVFDFLLRMKPGSGNALMLKDFRRIIRELRDDRKFKIGVVTYDGFQSQESLQLLRDAKFNATELSVDRNKGPYEDLREAIYERRIEFPEYMTYMNRGDTERTNITRKELLELTDVGRKIDHPPKGSKDLADAMAGVVHALMSNNYFRRGAHQIDEEIHVQEEFDATGLGVLDMSAAELGQAELEKALQQPQWSGPLEVGKYGLPPLQKNPFGALRRG